jgi:hypothetical protein
MKATQMAAGATAAIARLFGYSRPVMIETGVPYIPTPVGNLANANVKDTSTKLTLDIKQELTVDPRTMGLGAVDEMTITSISQRESWLTKFGWETADPTETLLWNTEVNPVTWTENGDELHLPACAFATIPFRWWRGTMKYRFQVVASSFHKGRLRISYDPNFQETDEYNTNYTYIIDLAKERDFTVDVGWGATTAFLRHLTPGLDDVNYSDGALTLSPLGFRNGTLSVYVVNELTVPNSTINNNIEINVFISTGDDFEVASPNSADMRSYSYFPVAMAQAATPVAREMTVEEYVKQQLPKRKLDSQAGEEYNQPDADLTQNEVEPMKLDASESMAVKISPTDKSGCVFFGDPVSSFRQCLKRYNLHSVVGLSGNDYRFFINVNSDFPYYRGYAPSAVNETTLPALGTAYNFCTMTLLNYLTPAFTARRGGLRWKYARIAGDLDGSTPIVVSRADSETSGYSIAEVTANDGGEVNGMALQGQLFYNHDWDGGFVTMSDQNPVVEFEVPFYNTFRFATAKNADVTAPTADFGSFHRYCSLWSKSASDVSTVMRHVSVGEDFVLAFFTGAPVLYYQPSDPPADDL